MNKITVNDIERLVRASGRKYEYIATDWRDGLLLGNGSLAAISYAPGGMEWVVNKNDVFDRRTYKPKQLTPHHEVMKMVESGERETFFLDELEKRSDGYILRSITPCILKLYYGNGELGWGAPAFPKISGDLSLYDGVLSLSADAHFVHSGVKSLIPRNRDVLALRMEGCAVADWDHKIELYRPYNEELDEPLWSSDAPGEIAFLQTLPEGKGKYAVALKAVAHKPDISKVTYDLPKDFDFSSRKENIGAARFGKIAASFMNSGDVDIFISVFSDYDTEDPLSRAKAEVKRAAEDGFSALEEECKEFWRDYWEKSMVDFGSYKILQDYWVFSMYELAAAYKGAPQPALSGMLYGPLSATSAGVTAHNYTSDQNIQIPLLPVSIVNHPELVTALADTFMNAREEITRHTKYLFSKTGGEGMFIPLVSNQNGAELVSGCYRYTMCGGAYVALVLARTWEYTRDDDLMRVKLFPLIYEINKFYVNNMLHKKEDGKYHLDPTVPPEIFYFTSDETATLAMLRTSLRVGLEFAKLSGLSDSETEKWRDVLAKYPDIAKRSCGSWWGGPDVPEDHFSFGTHILYPFFPAEEYVSDSDRVDAEATLRYIERSAVERCYAGTHGWHFIHDWSWHLYYSTLAHLGGKYKDTVWEQLFEFLDHFAKPNGLFTHNSIVICPSSVSEENHDRTKGIDEVTADITNGPSWYGSGKCATPNIHSKDLTAPVIEGNSIFLLRATETLIQSFDGILRLFPGVPDDFEGSFYQLRARGGFTVSASMSGGVITASVTAKVDSQLLLNAPTPLKLSKNAELIEMHGIRVYRVSLSAGEELFVSSDI